MFRLERPLEPSGSGGFSLSGPFSRLRTSSRRPSTSPRRQAPAEETSALSRQGIPCGSCLPDLPSRTPSERPKNLPTVRGGAGIVRRHDEVGATSIGGWTLRGEGGTTLETRRLRSCALGDSRGDNAGRSGGGRAQGAGDRCLEVPGEDRLGRGRHHPRPLRDHARDPRERVPRRPIRPERRRGATGRHSPSVRTTSRSRASLAGIRAPRRTIS